MDRYGPYTDQITTMLDRLGGLTEPLETKRAYHDGDGPAINLGIALSDKIRHRVSSPWSRIIIDKLAERIVLSGVSHPDEASQLILRDVARLSDLQTEVNLAARDSLIYGTGFLSVSEGEDGVRISAEDPATTTGIWDYRTRRLAAALKLVPSDDTEREWELAELYLPGETVTIDPEGIVDVRATGVDRVPVVPVPNAAHSSTPWGHSEINLSIRRLCDEHARIKLLHIIASEFYSTPQKIALGIASEDLEDSWSALMGHFLTLDDDEEKMNPRAEIIQLAANNPQPFLDSMDQVLREIAAASSIPASLLSLASTSVPSSADALRYSEISLIKKIETKLPRLSSAVTAACDLALDHYGIAPDGLTTVRWSRISTPSPGATADALSKLTSIRAISPTSDYLYAELGLSPEDAEKAREEVNTAAAAASLDAILGAVSKFPEPSQTPDATPEGNGTQNLGSGEAA